MLADIDEQMRALVDQVLGAGKLHHIALGLAAEECGDTRAFAAELQDVDVVGLEAERFQRETGGDIGGRAVTADGDALAACRSSAVLIELSTTSIIGRVLAMPPTMTNRRRRRRR